MRLLRIGLALAAAAGLACSTTPPPQAAWDHSVNFSNLKTFEWHEDPAEQKAPGGAIVDARFVYQHIQKEVVAELGKKGLRPAAEGSADFFVEYHVRAAGVLERDKYGAYSWWSAYNYLGSSYYKENILVLDVRDREKKLIWRGWVSRITGSSPEAIAKDIRKAVGQILAPFPPAAASAS